MLSIQRGFLVASYLKNCVFYSSRPFKRHGKIQNAQKNRTDYSGRYGRNPGVDNQIAAMQLTEADLRDPNILEDMEKQFWNADKVLDDVERAEHIDKELKGIFQITRKQFKGKKYPNMLLWDEKQEIRTLHSQDPETWTVMKLAFSYPASPSIIKKILEGDWKLRTQEDIDRHDNRVRENWKAFKNGTLDVPSEDLVKHLRTFSNRTKLAPNMSSSKEVGLLPKKVEYNPAKDILKDGGVFGNIYKSYKDTQNYETKDIPVKEESSVDKGLQALYYPPSSDTFIIPQSAQNVQKRTNNILTLDEMKQRVLKDAPITNLSHDEQKFIKGVVNNQEVKSTHDLLKDPIGVNVNETSERRGAHTNCQESQSKDQLPTSIKIEVNDDLCRVEETGSSHKAQKEPLKNAGKFVDLSKLSEAQYNQDMELISSFRTAKTARIEVDNETLTKAVKDYVSQSSESYPLQIVIPKELWKKGALYRVKDRFYTDDGEFLYRVPGLIQD